MSNFILFFVFIFPSLSFAQITVADPHPDQTQCFFRFQGPGAEEGQIEVLRPLALASVRLRIPGVPRVTEEKEAMLLYDKRNPFPETWKAGSNYLFLKGGDLATVSADGFLYAKGGIGVLPDLAGGVYFTEAGSGKVFSVDSSGAYSETGLLARGIRVLGGNYFLEQGGVLVTIRSDGVATRKEGWIFPEVAIAGGNFFTQKGGGLVTVDSTQGFFHEAVFSGSPIRQAGGNYFIRENGTLTTVDREGRLQDFPEIRIAESPRDLGYSFFRMMDGSFVAVDSFGMPHRKWVRVSTTGVFSRIVEGFQDELDPVSKFTPSVLP